MADGRLVASCLLLSAHFLLLLHCLQFLPDLFCDLPQIYADGRPPAVLLLLYLDVHEIHVEVTIDAAVHAKIIQVPPCLHLCFMVVAMRI